MRVEFLDEAKQELIDAIVHYESQRSGLGFTFNRHVWEAVDRLCEFPESAAEIAPRVRRFRIAQFPFGIVYTTREDVIILVAVMHLHREPGYWSSRLK